MGFKKIKHWKIFAVVLVVLVIGASGYGLFRYTIGKTAKKFGQKSVILTMNGFEPKELDINLGDTVVFTTKLKQQFWPASDLHPTHLLYPEFDPKKALDSNDSWSFKFNKPGRWTYHDHLNPNIKGTIIVAGKALSLTPKETPDQCDALKGRVEQDKCWGSLFDFTLSSSGLPGGFSLMKELLNKYPDFEPECHTMSHKVGAKAYELFVNHENLALTADVSLCGYGFFHGFTETLASSSGDINQARQFCQTALVQLGSQFSDIGGQCYHGFGHGSVETYDPGIWGNEEAMIEPAIKLCTAVADTSDRLFRCGTGVFDSISISYFTHQYKLAMNTNDPFWLCKKQQTEEFRKACYVSLDSALMMMNKADFLKSAKEVEKISNDNEAQLAMGSLALPPFWIKNQLGEKAAAKAEAYYETKGLSDCKSLQSRLYSSCVRTLAYALTIDEQASSQYKIGLEFCRNQKLSAQVKDDCLGTVWSSIKVTFPLAKVAEICQTEILGDEKKYCQAK